MRLKSFTVHKLFGFFDHHVQFNLDERVTIIHAPNGFGKTVLLKMISGMFGGSLNIFRTHEYREVVFDFVDGSKLFVRQGSPQKELLSDQPRRMARAYSIEFLSNGEIYGWNPDDRSQVGSVVSPSFIERYIPHVSRVGDRAWRDRNYGDVVNYNEILDRYWHELPPSARRHPPHPEWLAHLRSSVHCRLIETHRLVSSEKQPERSRDDGPVPAVKTYTAELYGSISRLLAESATLSQALDQTFPNRVLQRMQDQSEPASESVLRRSLIDLEAQRGRLAAAGLLNRSDEGAISYMTLEPNTRKLLEVYVLDTSKKLDVYTPMLLKLELFTEILNSRYKFKTVRTSRDEGLEIRDYRGLPLAPESLSSGEQHELILIYDLLFRTQKNTLLLIDEPEISLHVAWQKRFIPDLERIISLTGLDAVLATHSAQMIGSYLDLTVQLQAPDDYVFDPD